MGKTLITNGTIVTAADMYRGDVLIEGEKVVMIGKALKAAGAKRIDATGIDIGSDYLFLGSSPDSCGVGWPCSPHFVKFAPELACRSKSALT